MVPACFDPSCIRMRERSTGQLLGLALGLSTVLLMQDLCQMLGDA